MSTHGNQTPAFASGIKVSVIIPTTAEVSRYARLVRCVESIRHSSATKIQIIAVVNGAKADEEVCNWLQRQEDVLFHYVETPSAPNAVLEGRKLVRTEFFSTLDDDDEYLAGATDRKQSLLANEPTIDLVVTNSCFTRDGSDHCIYQHLSRVPANPLRELFVKNWLNSGNALYRSDAIGIDCFADPHPFVEWTWLGFKFATDGKRIQTIDEATHRIHASAGSLSFSNGYVEAYIPLFTRMLACAPPKTIRRIIAAKKSAAFHKLSEIALAQGRRGTAFDFHLRSLLLPGGLKYISYTRKLMLRLPKATTMI